MLQVIFLLSLTLFSLNAEDVSVSAYIIHLKGDVKIQHAEHRTFKARKGDLLTEGDILTTGENGLVLIAYPDSSKLKLGSNSEIQIENIIAPIQDHFVGHSSVFLKYGRLFLDIFHHDGQPAHITHTHYAEFGVRGTKLFVGADEGSDKVWASVQKGEVEVIHKKNPLHKDSLQQGHGMIITKESFTHPKNYQWVKEINYDVHHLEDHSGGFDAISESRHREFHQKKENWQRDEKKWLERKSIWNKADEHYQKKLNRFKEEHREILSKRKIIRSKRKEFLPKRISN